MNKGNKVIRVPSWGIEDDGAQSKKERPEAAKVDTPVPRDAMLDLLLRDMPELVVGHLINQRAHDQIVIKLGSDANRILNPEPVPKGTTNRRI